MAESRKLKEARTVKRLKISLVSLWMSTTRKRFVLFELEASNSFYILVVHNIFNLIFCVQNALLEFVKVVNVKQQVVSGTKYYITLEALDGDKKKVYEAKVWEKLWLNFKELQEFNFIGDAASYASA